MAVAQVKDDVADHRLCAQTPRLHHNNQQIAYE
jgi:hypothetical protein